MPLEPDGPDVVDIKNHNNREELGRLFCEATVGSEYVPKMKARKIFVCGKPAELYPKDKPEVALCREHQYLA